MTNTEKLSQEVFDSLAPGDTINFLHEQRIKSQLQSTHSLLGMLQSVKQTVFEAFVSKDRQAMRTALKYWCDKGCVMIEPLPPRFPWVD